MIEIKNLVKYYGDLKVLGGINLDIQEGEIFGLVGRSGVGKSTLLRCINGLETYDQGSLIVNGVDVKDLSKKELREFRKEIGMIFQQFSLLNRLTVYDNIALPLKCWGYKEAEIKERVHELLEIIDLPDKINARPNELSGGQKQRVAIARALSMEPKILLCDEATSALDPKTAQSVTNLLKQINRELGITIVVVTHHMSVLKNLCEKTAILEGGMVMAEGSVENIFFEQPPALINLIGQRDIVLPDTGLNIEIFLSKDNMYDPIVTKMARKLNIDCRIVGGEMDLYDGSSLGSIIINIPVDKKDMVEKYLEDDSIAWKNLSLEKYLAREECVS